MSILQFIASLASSLAWPLVVLAIAVLFRVKIAELLSGGITRLKAGPIEVEWERTLSEARVELDQPGVLSLDTAEVPGPVSKELADLARVSPVAAVIEGYARVERALQESLADVDDDAKLRVGGAGLARLAAQHGRINDETARAIEGLTVLRNLAAHGRAGGTTSDRATDYLALIDAVLFVLRPH
jgi:hypothetical protein